MIKCAVCGLKFGSITNGHLAKHGLGFQQYKSIYPQVDTGTARGMEIRDRISKALTGRTIPEQVRRRMKHQAWNKGLTKETHPSLLNTSLKLTGRVPSSETREKWSRQRIGKHPSVETRHKISAVLTKYYKNNLPPTGSEAPNWKGGIAQKSYSHKFNKTLKEWIKYRDNHTCQVCDTQEFRLPKGLCIHHIDYNKHNNQYDNLISLCHSCNNRVNTHREGWIKYFVERLRQIPSNQGERWREEYYNNYLCKG